MQTRYTVSIQKKTTNVLHLQKMMPRQLWHGYRYISTQTKAAFHRKGCAGSCSVWLAATLLDCKVLTARGNLRTKTSDGKNKRSKSRGGREVEEKCYSLTDKSTICIQFSLIFIHASKTSFNHMNWLNWCLSEAIIHFG